MSTPLSSITAVFAPELFRDRQVLVSDASSGIGLDVARGLAALGASVLATGSSTSKLDTLHADAANAGIRFARLDVRDGKAIAVAMDALDRLDVLVNAAGVARPHAEYEPATFLDVMDVNLYASMRTAMAAHSRLSQTQGCIINYASMLSFLADADVPAYCASKTGLLGLTRALAHAWGPEGIRVNAVAPGYHMTEMTRPLWSQPHHHGAIAAHSALKRWGTTMDLVGPPPPSSPASACQWTAVTAPATLSGDPGRPVARSRVGLLSAIGPGAPGKRGASIIHAGTCRQRNPRKKKRKCPSSATSCLASPTSSLTSSLAMIASARPTASSSSLARSGVSAIAAAKPWVSSRNTCATFSALAKVR